MENRSPAELRALSDELDIFDGSEEPPRHLLEHGLYPPLPICGSSLVWGFALISAAERHGISTVRTTRMECTRLEALETALLLEGRRGRYSWSERTAVVDRSGPSPHRDVRTRLSVLTTGNPGLFEQVRQFRSLCPPLQQMVVTERMDLRTARKVSGLPPEVYSAVAARTDLSVSRVRLFLSQLLESVRRDALEADAAAVRAEELLEADDPVAAVRRLRYPDLTEMERRFEKLRDRALAGTGIVLRAPPGFEGDAYALQFEVSTPEELRRRTTDLKRLNEVADGLFELL